MATRANSSYDAIDDAGLLNADPQHSILIALGDLSWLETGIPQGGLVSFVVRGGAVLIASDRNTGSGANDRGSAGAIFGLAGVQIDGAHRVMARKNSESLKKSHRGQPDRPFVEADELTQDDFENPFEGWKVATNVPSFLTVRRELPGVITLAHLPDGMAIGDYSARGGSQVFDRKKGRVLFAVGGHRGDGRFLIMADHSIFINEMMLAEDCDNFSFSMKCLEWLNADCERTKAMLMEDGRAYSKFDVLLKPLPPPPPLKLLEGMFLHRDEITDKLQQSLAELHEPGDNPNYRRAIARGRNRDGMVLARRLHSVGSRRLPDRAFLLPTGLLGQIFA